MVNLKKSRYRSHNGKTLIDVRVRSAKQLFDARDPAPFRERDLDDDFVKYIETSADEFSLITPLQILIHIEEAEDKKLKKEEIQEAIHSHFEYQVDLKRKELTRILKTSQIFLLIGFMCLLGSLAIVKIIPEGILREGLVIFGWVGMWKPIELMLFDWYPVYYKLRLYRKLSRTGVDVNFNAAND